MTLLRTIKTIMVGMVAFFFSLVAFGNITDYAVNWQFIHHVLSMDTILPNSQIMWRAITHPTIQQVLYLFIILWEGVTAIVCWVGTYAMWKDIKNAGFADAKKLAYVGLFMGYLLYMVGFLIIASEWFGMWQSDEWNGQRTAGLFTGLFLLILIYISQEERE